MAENALSVAATGAAPSVDAARPAGVPGYPGPFPVGRYAVGLRDQLRKFQRVCIEGEVTSARIGNRPNIYFELRDADGAMPCAMWRDDFEQSGLTERDLRDGVRLVAAGGRGPYPGPRSPSVHFPC